MYEKLDLVNPACVIDANHSNSNKEYAQQIRIVKEILHNRTESSEIHNMVKGLMIEVILNPDPKDRRTYLRQVYHRSMSGLERNRGTPVLYRRSLLIDNSASADILF